MSRHSSATSGNRKRDLVKRSGAGKLFRFTHLIGDFNTQPEAITVLTEATLIHHACERLVQSGSAALCLAAPLGRLCDAYAN